MPIETNVCSLETNLRNRVIKSVKQGAHRGILIIEFADNTELKLIANTPSSSKVELWARYNDREWLFET